MRLIEQFSKPDTIDCYTFVFDEKQPDGMNTMLALSEDGYAFSQWTTGLYEPEGTNEHLGRPIELRDVGAKVLDAFFYRLSIPKDWEEIHDAIEQIIREDGDE